MDDNMISVIDLAAQLGRRKQTVFKVLRRLNIQPAKATSANSRGVLTAFVTNEEAQLVRNELAAQFDPETLEAIGLEQDEAGFPGQRGVFYLLLLEPNHDPRTLQGWLRHKPSG